MNGDDLGFDREEGRTIIGDMNEIGFQGTTAIWENDLFEPQTGKRASLPGKGGWLDQDF